MSAIKQIIFLTFLLIAVMVACVYMYIKQYAIQTNTPLPTIFQEEIKPTEEIKEKVTEEITENKELSKKLEEKTNELIVKKVEEVKETPKPKIIEKKIIKEEKIEEKVEEKKVALPSVKIPKEKKIEELSKKIQPKKIQASVSTQEELDAIVSKEKIFFKRLGTDITEKSYKIVEAISKVLLKNPNAKVEIGGHTDAKGAEDVNEWVSLQRAKSVKNELVKLGVSKDRIIAKGYGESRPLVPNDKNGYSFENRRVEFKIIEE